MHYVSFKFPEFVFTDRRQRHIGVGRQRHRGDDPHQAAATRSRSGKQVGTGESPHQRNRRGLSSNP